MNVKSASFLTVLGMFCAQAFAFEDSTVASALESRFERVYSHSSIVYTPGDGELCDLNANVLVQTSALISYECNVCLISDDNLLWDYSDLECDFARD